MCQLEDFGSMTYGISFFAKCWQLRKRIPRWTKNRAHLIKHKVGSIVAKKERTKMQEHSLNLKAGDIVRVRSKEEILQTLDGWRRFQGCTFMSEMWEYCGGTYRVLKKVNHILDERDMKIKKCKDMVILDGLICPGSWPFKECDRCCFLFWKEAWLEKVSKVANQDQVNSA